MVNIKRYRHRYGFFLLFVLILLSTACGPRELAEQASRFVDPLPTTPGQDSSLKEPASTRRPFPTSLPTEEMTLLPTATATLQVSTEVVEEEVEFSITDIVAVYQAQLSAERLRVKTTSENLATGENQTLIIEFVMPDSFRLVSGDVEIIVSKGRTYEKLMSANWLVSPIEMMDKFDGVFEPYLDDSAAEVQLNDLKENISEVTFIAVEPLGDLETYLVTFTEAQPADTLPILTTIWIGSEDGLLHREVHEFMIDADTVRITTAYEYGDAVHIDPPLP